MWLALLNRCRIEWPLLIQRIGVMSEFSYCAFRKASCCQNELSFFYFQFLCQSLHQHATGLQKSMYVQPLKEQYKYSYVFSKPPMHYMLQYQVEGVSLFACIRQVPFCLNEYFWPVSILLDTEKQICHDSCSCWAVVKIYHVTSETARARPALPLFGVVEEFACSDINDSALSVWNGFIIPRTLLF